MVSSMFLFGMMLLFVNLFLFAFECMIPLTYLCVFSLLICVFSIYTIVKRQGGRITFSTAILLYTMATQYGLVIPYAFMGDSVLSSYASWTIQFTQMDSYLIESIYLANIAVLAFTMATYFVEIKENYLINPVEESSNNAIDFNDNLDVEVRFKSRLIASALLLIVILYFAYHVLFGTTSLVSTYDVFRESSAYTSNIYSYILICFYVGTIYLASAGKIRDNLALWALWMLVVLFFALNGNKGEFMYALLATIGLYGVKGMRISMKMIVEVCVLLFVIIPFITAFRDVGLMNNLSSIQLNFFDSFVEMGMQIRTSVYLLRDIAEGTQSFLFGRSYIQPILNICLFFISGKTTATSAIRARYPGYGFNQVIESYVNLGVLGVVIYFSVIGYFITKFENKKLDSLQLALLGSITCILINATRNYFAFVPGQILIVSAIYIFAKYVKIKV